MDNGELKRTLVELLGEEYGGLIAAKRAVEHDWPMLASTGIACDDAIRLHAEQIGRSKRSGGALLLEAAKLIPAGPAREEVIKEIEARLAALECAAKAMDAAHAAFQEAIKVVAEVLGDG